SDGYVYIVDRVKEVIKTYGRQVVPAEVESVLLRHPAVREVAVVPTPSPKAGEEPKAFVVLAEGRRGDFEMTMELTFWVARHLVEYKVPAEFEFVQSLPKGPGGKVVRRALGQYGPYEEPRLRS